MKNAGREIGSHRGSERTEPTTEMVRLLGRRVVACNLSVVVRSSCKILPEQNNIYFLLQSFSPTGGGFLGPLCDAVSTCWTLSWLLSVQGSSKSKVSWKLYKVCVIIFDLEIGKSNRKSYLLLGTTMHEVVTVEELKPPTAQLCL